MGIYSSLHHHSLRFLRPGQGSKQKDRNKTRLLGEARMGKQRSEIHRVSGMVQHSTAQQGGGNGDLLPGKEKGEVEVSLIQARTVWKWLSRLVRNDLSNRPPPR